jgi:protein phosphatase
MGKSKPKKQDLLFLAECRTDTVPVIMRKLDLFLESNGERRYLVDSFFANSAFPSKALNDPEYEVASTTLTYAYVNSNEIIIGHIGDCRAHVKQGNKLVQLTKDHTQHQMLIDQKVYTKAQLKNASGKNLITTAISQVVPMKPEFFSFKVSDYVDDLQDLTIYLMSDGAHAYWEQNPRFSPNTMKNVTKLSNSLLRRIERKGAKDDYSLVSCTFSIS